MHACGAHAKPDSQQTPAVAHSCHHTTNFSSRGSLHKDYCAVCASSEEDNPCINRMLNLHTLGHTHSSHGTRYRSPGFGSLLRKRKVSSCDGQIVWSRSPDPPLRTWEQAGSASLTVTLISIELISHHTNQPPSCTPTGRNRAAYSGVFLSRMSKCCTRDGQLRCLHCECRQKWIRCPNCNSARGGSVCSIFRCLACRTCCLAACIM